jgi:hypothetical protein
MRAVTVIALGSLAGCYDPDLPACAPDCAASLEVVVTGRGTLVVEPLGVECKSRRDGQACAFDATVGMDVQVLVIESERDFVFTGWTTDNCDGESHECEFVLQAPATLVGARFVEIDD